MSRGPIAERARLWLLVAGRALRVSAGRFSARALTRWRFGSTATDRLLIAPQDLRTGDPTRASEIYSGRFAFAGKILVCEGRSPFEVTPPSRGWAEVLAGFGWLRHLRAAESSIMRANARVLVEDWMDQRGKWDAVQSRPEVAARRIMSWLMHAPFLLLDADPRFYRRFLRSLSRQVRALYRASGSLDGGLPRLQALMALTFAGLCMAGQARLLKVAGRDLLDELQAQILPDGGHVSRNPGALIELLLDLLPLREAYGARNLSPPAALIHAIDRMMPMLRFFRHGDGTFANFNGMGPTPPDLLATVLAYDDARGKPVANAAHSGYQRLEGRALVALIDTGPPPPMPVSQDAHAGCLAFELSAGRNRIVVNCGLPAVSRESWRHLARTTAAHSTAVVNNASSCRFLSAAALQRLIGPVIIAGPTDLKVTREEEGDRCTVRASHDGYAQRYGLVHERSISLQGGRRLEGEDAFLPARGVRLPVRTPDRFALRFHLHPSVRASRLTHRHGVMLTLPNRDVWTFEAYDHQLKLEDSVYLSANDGPRRTTQIVVYGRARQTPRIRWSFVQVDPAESWALHRGTEEPELPL